MSKKLLKATNTAFYLKITIMLFVLVIPIFSQNIDLSFMNLFSSNTYICDYFKMPYRYFVPNLKSLSDQKIPLILYLHSEHESGSDNTAQLTTECATIWIEPDHLQSNPCVILAPQIPKGSSWTDEIVYNSLLSLIRNFVKENPIIDVNRIYIEGLYMGGTGVWNMIFKNPQMFAAALIFGGNANAYIEDTSKLDLLKNMPIMVVASEDDPVSPSKEVDDIVAALKRHGNNSIQYHKWVKGSNSNPAWKTAFEKYEVVYNFLFMNNLKSTNYNQIDPSTLFVTKDLKNGIKQIWDITEDTIYVMEGNDKAVVIDTGMANGNLYEYIKQYILKNKNIDIEVLITHNHGDHIKGIPSFVGASQFKQLYVHEADYDVVKQYMGLDISKAKFVKDGDKIPFNGKYIEVISVPGHSIGSVVFLYEDNLFTGDAIGTGDLWLNSGLISVQDYVNSIQHLADKVAGMSLHVWGGHTGECRYPLTQEYITQMLQCAKGIVDGSIVGLPYHRRPYLYSAYGRAHIVYSENAVKTIPATLSKLSLSSDKSNIETYYPINLNENFSPLKTQYTALVDSNNTPFVYIKAISSASSNTLSINGIPMTSGVPYKVNLSLGDNKFNILVTSQEGFSRTYTITIIQKDLSKEYISQLIIPGVWRIEDFGGTAPNEDMYLIEGSKKALLFDTGMGKGDLLAFVKKLTNKPVDVAITHGHGDHFGQVDQFMESKVYMSGLDRARLPATLNTSNFIWVNDGDLIDIGDKKFEVCMVPGHTLGSIVYLDRASKIAVTGDAISSGSYVFMFNATCTSLKQYVEAIKQFETRINNLNGLTLLVGHHWQEKNPLTGISGKQIFTDMRIAGEKILNGELQSILTSTVQGGKVSFLKQAYFGLAGLWYNPSNLIPAKAALNSLKIETTDGAGVLQPVFSSWQTDYKVILNGKDSLIRITPTAFNESSNIAINGNYLKSGNSLLTELENGENIFTIVVSAEDGSSAVYSVNIFKNP